jgi:ribosomal protein S18 acetylase RimI-like enzyme
MGEVRKLRSEDVPKAVESLSRAFEDDPLSIYLFPEARTRLRRLRRFFTLQLKRTYLPRGEVYTVEACRACALWLPPRPAGSTLQEMFRRQPLTALVAQLQLITIVGARLSAAASLMRLIEAEQPRVPHWYLGPLGTDPQFRKRGLGSAVLAPVLERCDRDGVGAYLESSKEDNLDFFRRHAFEVRNKITVPEGDLPLWLMWREPQTRIQ